jgi:hypothetical protein
MISSIAAILEKILRDLAAGEQGPSSAQKDGENHKV